MPNFVEICLYQTANRRTYYWFRCLDCETVSLAQRHNIARGRALCDCKTKPIKGFRKYPEYAVWATMVDRCTRPKNTHFAHYGGRGICVDPKWKTFLGFWEDMGPRPGPEYSIERIDVNGGYTKSNCKWATIDEQTRNRTNNIWITYRGQTKLLLDWARELNMPYDTLKRRWYRKKTIQGKGAP